MAMRDMQQLYSYFQTPQFQNAWAYGDRSAGSLGLSDDEYNWFKSTGFQPYQPNAGTNVQQFDGVWKNTVVNPGETPKQFQTVTTAPVGAPTNTLYAQSIGATLPKAQTSGLTGAPDTSSTADRSARVPSRNNLRNSLRTPAQTTTSPTQTTRQTAGSHPIPERDLWATPQPTTTSPTGQLLPAGFDLRAGSTNPLINQAVYGSNYFPGNLPGFEGIANSDQFFALTPEQQGSYREALYLANQRAQQGTPRLPLPGLPGDTATGGTVDPQTGLWREEGGGRADRPPSSPSGTGDRQDIRSQLNGSAFNNGGGAPGGTTGSPSGRNRLPEIWDYRDSPEFQFRNEQAQRALNRQLLARGRSNSTFGVNALARLASEMGADEVDRQYNRALTANLTNYGRDISEDERAYSRFWGEDDREFNRNALVTQLGQRAAEILSGQAIGEADRRVGADQDYANTLLRLLTGYGSDQATNEWRGLSPLLDLILGGGQNSAAMWEGIGGLPLNILALMALGRR